MKKLQYILIMISISALFCMHLAWAEDWPPYVSIDDLPDAVQFLPPPPQVSSDPYKADLYYYQWGKENRTTPRGELAKTDADCSAEHLAEVFSEPMGIQISKESTPKIYEILGRAADTALIATKNPKKHHGRPRPYVEFKEPSLTPEDEESQNPNASYPSGHSTMGWAVALVLVEINPNAQDKILKRGYEYGESRVIAGAHYESDVSMARLVASAAIARMHADNEFNRDMEAAKKEYRDKKRKNRHKDSGSLLSIKGKSRPSDVNQLIIFNGDSGDDKKSSEDSDNHEDLKSTQSKKIKNARQKKKQKDATNLKSLFDNK